MEQIQKLFFSIVLGTGTLLTFLGLGYALLSFTFWTVIDINWEVIRATISLGVILGLVVWSVVSDKK